MECVDMAQRSDGRIARVMTNLAGLVVNATETHEAAPERSGNDAKHEEIGDENRHDVRQTRE